MSKNLLSKVLFFNLCLIAKGFGTAPDWINSLMGAKKAEARIAWENASFQSDPHGNLIYPDWVESIPGQKRAVAKADIFNLMAQRRGAAGVAAAARAAPPPAPPAGAAAAAAAAAFVPPPLGQQQQADAQHYRNAWGDLAGGGYQWRAGDDDNGDDAPPLVYPARAGAAAAAAAAAFVSPPRGQQQQADARIFTSSEIEEESIRMVLTLVRTYSCRGTTVGVEFFRQLLGNPNFSVGFFNNPTPLQNAVIHTWNSIPRGEHERFATAMNERVERYERAERASAELASKLAAEGALPQGKVNGVMAVAIGDIIRADRFAEIAREMHLQIHREDSRTGNTARVVNHIIKHPKLLEEFEFRVESGVGDIRFTLQELKKRDIYEIIKAIFLEDKDFELFSDSEGDYEIPDGDQIVIGQILKEIRGYDEHKEKKLPDLKTISIKILQRVFKTPLEELRRGSDRDKKFADILARRDYESCVAQMRGYPDWKFRDIVKYAF